jgi:hypothetical protein
VSQIADDNTLSNLVKINRDRILYSAFTTDQDLAQENSKCWFSTLNKIFKILKTGTNIISKSSICLTKKSKNIKFSSQTKIF